MQRLPLELTQRGNQRLTRPARNPAPTAIHRVTHERIPNVRKMHTNLMRAPGFELGTREGVPAKPLQHAIVSDGLTPVRAHGHAGALSPMAPDRLIHRTAA